MTKSVRKNHIFKLFQLDLVCFNDRDKHKNPAQPLLSSKKYTYSLYNKIRRITIAFLKKIIRNIM